MFDDERKSGGERGYYLERNQLGSKVSEKKKHEEPKRTFVSDFFQTHTKDTTDWSDMVRVIWSMGHYQTSRYG